MTKIRVQAFAHLDDGSVVDISPPEPNLLQRAWGALKATWRAAQRDVEWLGVDRQPARHATDYESIADYRGGQ